MPRPRHEQQHTDQRQPERAGHDGFERGAQADRHRGEQGQHPDVERVQRQPVALLGHGRLGRLAVEAVDQQASVLLLLQNASAQLVLRVLRVGVQPVDKFGLPHLLEAVRVGLALAPPALDDSAHKG